MRSSCGRLSAIPLPADLLGIVPRLAVGIFAKLDDAREVVRLPAELQLGPGRQFAVLGLQLRFAHQVAR